MRIWCDMDGVLADFDTGYGQVFGVRPSKADDNVDWDKVRAHENFYRNLPVMMGGVTLWRAIERISRENRLERPSILSGVPKLIRAEAAANKRAWVDTVLGPQVDAKFCPSRLKSMYCNPGDVLIDDWEKYRGLWEKAGGTWVTHVTAEDTIRRLQEMFPDGQAR